MIPRGWDRRTTVFLTFALLFVIGTRLAPAQVFDLENNRIPITEIHGPARFHTGDDPRWSDPDFDDSGWPLLRLDQSWNDQGYEGYSGFAWYRFRVVSHKREQNLALFAHRIRTSYEIFANGKSIGTLGGMPPHARFVDGRNELYPISSLPTGSENSILVAIRVWQPPHGPFSLGGGSDHPLMIGDATRLDEWAQLQTRSTFWDISVNNLELVVFFVVGFAGLVLFLMRRQDREYVWFAAYQIIAAGALATYDWQAMKSVAVHPWLIASTILESSYRLCMLEFVWRLMKARRGQTYWVAVSAMTMRIALLSLVDAEWASSHTWDWIQFLLFLPYDICILLLLRRRSPEGENDGRLLLLPMGLWFLSDALINFTFLFVSPGNARMTGILDWLIGVVTWPFPMGLNDITFLCSEAAVLSILMLRFARTRRDEERFKSELEAARTVQQVLIPEEIPSIPGLILDCVYKPAGQVGGDFFQILPTPNNGALIVIGDVSGKGMPAAMAVSLLVGTVRTLSHYTQSPAEILNAMNERMLGRSKNGFTTCLVLRLDPDGAATMANAGHLAPYRGSKELPVESGLPLGLAAEADYIESTFHLDPGEELTLVTDGIAEARAKTGELFGFERTASISILSAAHIAATAVAFGQEDDVTVLKIRRHPLTDFTSAPDGVSRLSPTIN